MPAHSFDIADRYFQPGMEQVFIPGTIVFLSKLRAILTLVSSNSMLAIHLAR